jgi:ABC-type Zn uptake system ZnuABC Zn-binding protein ZnuA
MPRLAFVTAALAALLLGACGSSEGGDTGSGQSDRVRVVASTALIAEFASIVAGDDADVEGLIPAGVDVHGFEPAPAAAASIARADVVFVNGYNLEETLLDVILENLASEVEVVPVAAGLTPLEGGHDEDEHEDEADHEDGDLLRADGDPHFWLDPANAIHYVEQIRDHLVELDPAHTAAYSDRAAAYIQQLRDLDAEVRGMLETIPAERRTLVVLHDAYQYLARAYDFELTAALLPASAQQDAGASAVVDLIELVQDREVPAIYREPQFGAAVLDSIASETSAEVLTIYSTYAGDVDTYVEFMRANAQALVDGLGA